jgi:diguanylate cyclase (GGDEF)-like protein/putative nucleotidyltransferase with HDIG domain
VGRSKAPISAVVLRALGLTNVPEASGEEPEDALRDNALAIRTLTPGMLAKAQAGLFAAAGVLGFVGVLLPHPPGFNVLGLVGLQFGCVLSAVILVALGERTPRWLIKVTPFAGTVLISGALLATGDSTSAYMLFYLWIGIYAFYFLPRHPAALLGAFAILNYAATIVGLRLMDGNVDSGSAINGDIHDFVLITGTLIVAGVFIFTLRDRVGRLITRLTDAASTDPLTGLLNRRGFHHAAETELERSRRGHRPFSLLLGDCDFFKLVNDRFGHQAGDEALQGIGRLLDHNKRRIDTAARIGGEEFAMVLPETDQHEAYILAERLRSRMRDVQGSEPVSLTMSFGVASYPVHGVSVDSLMRAADEALYAAKTLGRDRSVIHSAEVGAIISGNPERAGSDHAQLATVLSLAEALDVRDTGTARHSQTVGRYSELMGRALGLAREHVERIRLAGVLHDIGKIGVPDSILRKPGALNDDEYSQMRKHPEIGARILGGSGLEDIRRWILAHHERPDGHGYPHGLSEEEIPLEAKILAVADAYEAMTSDRVYRRSIGEEAARDELRRHSGRQFDPRVVEAFLQILDREDRDAEKDHNGKLTGGLKISAQDVESD